MAALSENAHVVHVDSSRGMGDWAKENAVSSNLTDREIHYLVDDCVKFVKREIRRGTKYDWRTFQLGHYDRGAPFFMLVSYDKQEPNSF
jgi:23S rRNA (cytosine1962-C5)-methyltransferase